MPSSPSAARSARTSAHRKSLEISAADLVATLSDKMGNKLVAFIADRDASTISRWKNGDIEPPEESLKPLRVAYQVFQLLESAEADATIRAWFMGMNPQLDDASPSEALKDGQLREVMAAARAFLAGG